MPKITLAGARKSAGYTQEELAKSIGVSRNLVNQWESGKARMQLYHLYAFCHLTGFSEADILLPSDIAKRNN